MWWVRVGEGALLTMELGNPRLEVDEVRHDGIPHRSVRPRGQHQLSLLECCFELRAGDVRVSERSDAEEVRRAAARLDGQALLHTSELDGVLRLELDLGAVLEVRALDSGIAWMLGSQSTLWGWRDGGLVQL